MNEFREKIIEDFKPKLLEAAKESLQAQIEAEVHYTINSNDLNNPLLGS